MQINLKNPSESSLNEFLPKWLKSYSTNTNMAKNTVNGYSVNIYKHILPYIGHIRLCDLTPDDIDYMIQRNVSEGLSATSQRYVIATLRKALNTAVKRKYIGYNVVTMVDIPKPKKYRSVFLTESQIIHFIEACKTSYNYLAVFLCVCLGLRRGEALALKWSDFDFNINSVHIQRTATPYKSGYKFSPCKTEESNRILLIPAFVSDYLKEWKTEQSYCKKLNPKFNPEDYLFCIHDDKLITTTTVTRHFKKLLSLCNFPNIRIHDLRHSWATLMLQKNVPLTVVSDMLGHSDVSTTLDIYSHTSLDMQNKAVGVITQLITF